MPPDVSARVAAIASAGIGAAALKARIHGASPHATLDIREPGEFERGHVFGSTNLPRRLLEFRIAGLVRDPATAITLCDDASGRAIRSASTLAALGYRDVAWLDGGIAAWQAAGHRVATGTNVPSKLFGEEIHTTFDVPRIAADELRRWRDAGRDVVVCDVRTPEEYAEACIPGAHAAPGFDYALHALDLAAAHDTVVLNCAGRTRSIIATRTLMELGVRNVVGLENGTIGWRLAGLDVERGAARHLAAPSAGSVDAAARAARSLADATGVARCDVAALRTLQSSSGGNVYLFDVRRVAEYAAGHIPGSTALPGGQAVQRADDFIAVRDAPIVLVDASGVQANLTAVWLKRMGYPNATVLDGGLDAWRAAGGDVETGRSRATPLGWREACAGAATDTVDPCAARIERTRDLLIVDVGTSRSFRRGHLPGAAWLPRGWLEWRIDALAGSPARPVLVSCDDGMQSVYAAAALRELGYTDVRALRGGTRAWRAAGRPLSTAPLPPQDDELVPPYHRGEQGMRDYIAWETRLVGPHATDAHAGA